MVSSFTVSSSATLSAEMALIFDLDGVIIHSTPMHTKAWEIYLEPYGIPPADIQARMHGLRNDEIVRTFFGEGMPHEEVHAHGAAKEALFRQLMAPQLDRHIVAGLSPFLDRYGHLPAGLASNAERPNIDFVLEGAGIRRYFQAVVDGHQVSRPKPFPDIYRKAAELLDVRPENCIVFEDSPAGVRAALDAGTRVVGLSTTMEQLDGVELMVADFEDPRLEKWLHRIQPMNH